MLTVLPEEAHWHLQGLGIFDQEGDPDRGVIRVGPDCSRIATRGVSVLVELQPQVFDRDLELVKDGAHDIALGQCVEQGLVLTSR